VKVKASSSETSWSKKGWGWLIRLIPDRLRRSEGRFALFIRRPVEEIYRGGLPALLREALVFLAMPLAILVVLAVRALRPLVLIRFGPLISHTIGHFAAQTELYLCRRDAGMDSQRAIDIFYHTSPVCNQQLKKMWDRTLHVSHLVCPVDSLNRLLPGGDDHAIPWPNLGELDIHGLLPRTPVHLSFTPEEEHQGLKALRELGIPDGTPFVCFHARDSAYLSAVHPKPNWQYHDYRDSDIRNHVPAAEELARRGYFAIRMGAIVKEALTTTNPVVIDYATKGRTDFLDIFLSSKCRFSIADNTGITWVAVAFRRPVAWVNFVILRYVLAWGPNDLFIPKKLWLREEHRLLTFREILDSEIGGFTRSEQYEQLGIEVVENTSEEITALAVEMDERLKGTWQTTEEDEELQRRFWSLFKPSELPGTIVSHIGAEFLRQNRELLD
jgi:putative glycosyltransferase (TIGR04372 family)